MPKSTRRKVAGRIATAPDRARSVPTDGPTSVTEKDIARRAYDLYLARGCEPGHELEDWLRAERELFQRSVASIA
jgi:DUF2934 family protein